MLSRMLIKKQPGRRWLKYIAALSLLVATLVIAAVALAVQDLTFQLDGNAKASDCGTPSGTNLGGTVPSCTVQTEDWNTLFKADGSNQNPLPAGFTNTTFVRDFGVKVSATDKCNFSNTTSTTFCTADPSTYATGSKDTLPVSGWQCTSSNNVNSKIDIMNAYAAAYTDSTSGDKILYFGLDKNKDNGNNDVGFWFLRSDANCDDSSGTATWTGAHSDGDILITSEFTSGGGVSGITVFRWAGGATGCIDSNDNANPKTGGCNQQAVGGGGDCKSAPLPEPDLCATTNSGPLITNTNILVPWLTSDATLGVGHTVVPPDFFEGGIDLTKAFATVSGGVPSCFNTFIADTRSSQTPTATLFDYARGLLGECKTTLTTKENATSPVSIGTGTVSSGTDTATLTVTGTSSFNGTLTWYLCGPDAALTTCDTTKGVLVTTTNNVNANGAYTSGTASLTSVGHYCWTAHFEPDAASKTAGVAVGNDNGANECFNVAPVTPTLVTAASCSADPCVVGDTLSDTATLTGAATGPGTNGGNTNYPSINATNGAAPGGSISWIAYGPDNCTTIAMASTSRDVSGNGTYPTVSQTAVSFTASKVGNYTFVASYSGDSPNTNGAGPSACPDTTGTENITVGGNASIASAQRWLPNDLVTVTGDANLNGTVTVTLYPSSDCTGTPVTGQSYTTTFTNATSPQVFNTSNSTFFVGTNSDGSAGGAPGDYSWKVHYADSGLQSPTDICEKSNVAITN